MDEPKKQAHSLPGDVGTRAAQIADLIVSPDTAANDIQRQAYWHVAHEAAKLALGVPEDDPACTDCGDTGVTYQTESPCSCRAALTPSALSGDAGEVSTLASIETMPMWAVGVVTDGVNAAVSQKAESDFDGHYFAVDPEDALEWEPTHWAALPSHKGAGE